MVIAGRAQSSSYQLVDRVVIAGVLALSVGQCIVCISAQLLSISVVVRYQRRGRSGGSVILATRSYAVGKSA